MPKSTTTKMIALHNHCLKFFPSLSTVGCCQGPQAKRFPLRLWAIERVKMRLSRKYRYHESMIVPWHRAFLATRTGSLRPSGWASWMSHWSGSSCPPPASQSPAPQPPSPTSRSSWGFSSRQQLRWRDHFIKYLLLKRKPSGPNSFFHLWNPILMFNLALGLWGIWNTTDPARRSRAMLAISTTWLSPENKTR